MARFQPIAPIPSPPQPLYGPSWNLGLGAGWGQGLLQSLDCSQKQSLKVYTLAKRQPIPTAYSLGVQQKPGYLGRTRATLPSRGRSLRKGYSRHASTLSRVSLQGSGARRSLPGSSTVTASQPCAERPWAVTPMGRHTK